MDKENKGTGALQVIAPQGFVATRFGFDCQLSTDTEHALAQAGVAAAPAVEAEGIIEKPGVRYA